MNVKFYYCSPSAHFKTVIQVALTNSRPDMWCVIEVCDVTRTPTRDVFLAENCHMPSSYLLLTFLFVVLYVETQCKIFITNYTPNSTFPYQECTTENLELHSYGLLLPCGKHYRGVEYVCCPGRGSSNDKGEPEERDVPAAPQTLAIQTSGKLNSV